MRYEYIYLKGFLHYCSPYGDMGWISYTASTHLFQNGDIERAEKEALAFDHEMDPGSTSIRILVKTNKGCPRPNKVNVSHFYQIYWILYTANVRNLSGSFLFSRVISYIAWGPCSDKVSKNCASRQSDVYPIRSRGPSSTSATPPTP